MNIEMERFLWDVWQLGAIGYDFVMDALKLVLLVYLICLARRAIRYLKQQEEGIGKGV